MLTAVRDSTATTNDWSIVFVVRANSSTKVTSFPPLESFHQRKPDFAIGLDVQENSPFGHGFACSPAGTVFEVGDTFAYCTRSQQPLWQITFCSNFLARAMAWKYPQAAQLTHNVVVKMVFKLSTPFVPGLRVNRLREAPLTSHQKISLRDSEVCWQAVPPWML